MDDTTSTPAVVLLSGGLDSSVLLHYVARTLGRAPIHAVSFNYGQRHAKEIECAQWQADAADAAAFRVIDVTFLGEIVKGTSALVAGGKVVPDLSDLEASQLDQPPTYVPNRNMILLSVAAAYAETQGIRDIFYGAQLALNRREPITVHAPFIHKKKVESVRLGVELGVYFGYTWSCYRGGERACGTCPTCVERLKAFEEAGVADPLPYANA